eukprot:scaffold14288_cov109-Isochrysis_galbana.AAC.4
MRGTRCCSVRPAAPKQPPLPSPDSEAPRGVGGGVKGRGSPACAAAVPHRRLWRRWARSTRVPDAAERLASVCRHPPVLQPRRAPCVVCRWLLREECACRGRGAG